jgi:hypothetical protein
MSNDQGSDDGKTPAGVRGLSEEAIERMKRAIIFGTGYGHPPKRTQFKKGQSGNPAGRPKKPNLGPGNGLSANALVLKEGARLISVRDGETTGETTEIEAVIRKQYATALRGNAYAQKHAIERYDWAEREQREQRLEEIEFWQGYVDRKRKAIADAEAKGEVPPNPLPHPDDLIIDYETGVWCKGPRNEKELAEYEELLKLRDVLIMQDALDKKLWTRDYSTDLLDGPGTGYIFADFINRHVPNRFRLSEVRFEMRMDRCRVTPKRELLKQVYRAWRALLGLGVRRGGMMPPLRFAKQVMEQINELRESDAASR